MEAVLSMLPLTEDFQSIADIFRQLGDCSRLRIFWLLCHCEECVINISALEEMSSPAMSHHLSSAAEAARRSTTRRRRPGRARCCTTP